MATSETQREVWPGKPYPLGPDWDGDGTNFSIFSETAHKVELCLFDAEGHEERIELTQQTTHNWHCYLPGVGPGQRYGYRVHGPYEPEEGLRFNPCKLLIDPYAKAIEGPVLWDQANTLPYVPDGSEDADLEPDDEDSRDAIPKCLVVDHRFDWEDDKPPQTPWADTVIYEVHVKGFTKQHPEVREDLRGEAEPDGDEQGRWLRVRRGDVELCMNFHHDEETRVPCTGQAVLLATHEARIEGDAVVLPPLSGAAVR